MARPDKVAAVTMVREGIERSSATVLTEYRGLTVAEFAQLRAQLRGADAEYAVVKNTLARLGARDAGVGVPDEVLSGPTAVTFCAGDPVAAAKVLRAFSRDHPALIVKGSILDGVVLDAADTLKLADLASREELLSKAAGLMQAIVAQPARLALASLSKAARLFAALAQQRAEAGETAEAPSTAAQPEAAGEPGAAPEPGPAGEPEPAPEPEATPEPGAAPAE